MEALRLVSNAFSEGDMIPKVYTCDGNDLSPHLEWEGAPAETESFVVICDDPDAPVGNWNHWLLFNIPPETRSLPEGFLLAEKGASPVRGGTNDFKRLEYGGPCPPSGVHRYFFKLYALDRMLDLAEGAKKNEIEAAMKGHILAQGELMGRYSRS